MSVNWSQLTFPSQMFFWQDGYFAGMIRPRVASGQYISASIMPTSKKSLQNPHLMKGLGGFYMNRISTRSRPKWLDTKKSHAIQSCSPISGAVAICMAYIMGFDPIIIVGFDCNIGDYKYMEKHPQHGHFNKRAANVHAHTQVRLLKNFGAEMNIINCSETEAMTRYNFEKTIKSLDDPNKNRCQSIVKGIYVDQCKSNGVPFITQWLKKNPI